MHWNAVNVIGNVYFKVFPVVEHTKGARIDQTKNDHRE